MRECKKIFICKKSVSKVAFCIFFMIAHGVTNAQQGKDLVGYWKFDEAKGKVAVDQVTGSADSIHYIFNDTKYPSDPIRRKGIYDSALNFDGFSNWIIRPADKFKTPTKGIT